VELQGLSLGDIELIKEEENRLYLIERRRGERKMIILINYILSLARESALYFTLFNS